MDLEFSSKVRPEQAKKTISQALAERFTYYSEDKWLDLLKNGLIKHNGAIQLENIIVARDDELIFTAINYQEPEVPTNYELIFENEDLVIVGKPAGSPVIKTGKIFYNTFTAVLRRKLNLPELSPLHRLDRETSGLMVFAKTKESAKFLQKQNVIVKKMYLAICHGEIEWDELECHTALGEIKDSSIPIKMHPLKKGGKECHTSFKTISRHGTYSIVQAELHTGRKHQIRAHLASLNHSIIGDRMYSFDGKYYLKMTRDGLSEDDYKTLGAKHQLLHSWKSDIIINKYDFFDDSIESQDTKTFESKIWCEDFEKNYKINELLS